MFIKKKILQFAENIKREFSIVKWAVCIAVSLALIVISLYYILTSGKLRTYSVDFSAIKQTVDEDETVHLELHGISLRKGSYDIEVGYVSDSPAQIEISLENDNYHSDILPATGSGGNSQNYHFDVRTGTDRGKIKFSSPSGTRLNLAFINIKSDKPLNNDRLIMGLFLLILIPCVWLGIYFYCRSTHKLCLIVAVGLVALQMLPFFLQPGLHLGIDTRAHMMRIEGIYYGLLDGQFPVVIYPEWNNSYGQLGVLYPNLFLYIPALFRMVGMSQLGACKLFLFLVVLASTLIALACARSIFKREWQIIMTVVIICLDDMRLLNMLGDGRIGGALLAEMFYPLVVAGLIEIFYQNKNKWYLIAYGVAGIFCCHILLSSIICIGIGLFTICSIKKLRDPGILGSIGKAILLFFGLVCGTFTLFLKFYFTDWGQSNLQWEDFIKTLWPRGRLYDDSKWIFIIVLIIMCLISLSIIIIRKHFYCIKGSYAVVLLISGIVLFLMSTSAFPWVFLRKFSVFEYYTNMLQDSYRFLSLADCFLAFCLPRLLEDVVLSVKGRHSYESKTTIATCGIIGLLCITSVVLVNYEYLYRNRQMLYYDAVIGDLEYQYDDYLPRGTMSKWYESDTGYISDEDAVSSLDYEREGTYVYYSYTNSKEGSYVEFPRFWYDGYVAEDEMAENIDVVKGDKNRTRVYLKVTDSPAIIRMWYHVPWYLTLAVAFSMGMWLSSLMLVTVRVYQRID